MKMAGKVVGMLMNKDIGLVTYYKENYGSILQCYATKSFLESVGFHCHVLYQKYNSTQYFELRLKNLLYHAYKSVRYNGYFTRYISMRKSMQNEKGFLNAEALKKQNEFVSDVIKPEGFTWRELRKLAKSESYVAFIAGSDQIWNASIHIDPIYFLKFASKQKRIALAPSFGISAIPDYNKKAVQNGVKGFERIAVREKTGENIIASLCNVPTIQVTDPVLLLNRRQWEQFGKNEKVPMEAYIFVHFLNSPKEKTLYEIEKLSKRLGSKILCFSYDYHEYTLFTNAIHINGNPREYVALIQNAKCVCTDSFHSTVFSILLHTEFYTFPRQHLHTASQSSRITDLLERYGLQEKYMKSGKIVGSCQLKWDEIDRITEENGSILNEYLVSELSRCRKL